MTISIFSKIWCIPISILISYWYFVNIDILTKNIDMLSLFRKISIYRQSIFHKNTLKTLKSAEKCPYWYQYLCLYQYQYWYFQIYRYRYFKNVFIDINIFKIDNNINIFKNGLIDIFKNDHIDIDIFQKCQYIDNQYLYTLFFSFLCHTRKYLILIYRTGLIMPLLWHCLCLWQCFQMR